MHLNHLLYYSSRTTRDPQVIRDILSASRRNNQRNKITGALFVQENHFFQVLEGPRAALSELFRAIMNDDRHTDVVLTLFEELNFRMYSDWYMAVLTDENPKVRQIYNSYAVDVSSPDGLSGAVIWEMIEKMSNAVSGKRDIE